MILFFKTLLGIAFQIAFFALLMLLPVYLIQGTGDWSAALFWLQLYALITLTTGIYLVLARPGAVEARMRAGRDAQTPADRMALGFMTLGLSLPLIIAALDVFSWQLLPPPTETARGIGLAVYGFGFLLILLAMLGNEFAAPTVHIQTENGHKLADTGVYAYLRHPMYTGFLLFTCGTTLWLGSYAATLLAGIMLVAATVYRIGIEEATLRQELDGYADYMQRVRTRFLPFIF